MTRHSSISTSTCTLPDGRRLAYCTAGVPEGDPVVAHHGTPGCRLLVSFCADAAAAEGVRLVVPDRPGYGRSTSPPRGWSWNDWRNDLHELLDTEGIDQAPLVGFSGGGPFALAAADGDRTPRVGLISSVIPPSRNGLALLSRIPFALQQLFRLSKPIARIGGPEALARQYTSKSVSSATATAISKEFQGSLRQGPAAVTRETRLFASESSRFDSPPPEVPVRAWHGTRDTITPLGPVRSFLQGHDADGTLVSTRSDHFGTLLDRRREVFEWASR
jgi:pimeloyl-ACP methyl ester carboxylesterase